MRLTYTPYTLELQHTFTVSSNSRSTTPIIITQITYEGFIGYGEASMPPYLEETSNSVQKFLSKVKLQQFNDPLDIAAIHEYVDGIESGNTAAKASIDIAMHDLIGKIHNKPLYELWGFDPEKTPFTSYTIGIDTPSITAKKVAEANDFRFLKIKLGVENDKSIIETIRKITNKPLYVDVNQGWKDKYYALDMIFWLQENGVVMVEQPLPKNQLNDIAWLTSESPLPIIADEGIQRLDDLKTLNGIYSGVNIKLMKCTGLFEAKKMINLARKLGLKTMIGCMTETSCGVSAAAQLSPIVDYADLDGPLLIKNDMFTGINFINGKIGLSNKPGIGVSLKL